MPVTVNVNKISVAHQGSNGTFLSFPDVCKTPPGPVPVPYPNIAQTSDLTDGTTTVKVDGNPVMTKKAKIALSTGDEAGVALGVLSNKIKGQAQAILYSFDVKFEGQNVVRLTDPAQQNMGSGNAFGPALLQEPLFVDEPALEGCAAAQKEQEKQQESHKAEDGKCGAGWNDSGVFLKHQKVFQDLADEMQYTIYLRNGNWHCVQGGIRPWIPEKHQPKPHDLMQAKTIKGTNIEDAREWLRDNWERVEGRQSRSASYLFPPPEAAETMLGVLMSLKPGEHGKPLRSQKFRKDSNGYYYTDKWITGDYDLQDLMRHDKPDCVRVTGEDWARFKREANKKMGWDGIQHPYQAEWVAVTGAPDAEGVFHAGESFSMAQQITAHLKASAAPGPKPAMAQVRITPEPKARTLPVIDSKLTIVSPGKAPLATSSDDEAVNALLCYGCHTLADDEGETA